MAMAAPRLSLQGLFLYTLRFQTIGITFLFWNFRIFSECIFLFRSLCFWFYYSRFFCFIFQLARIVALVARIIKSVEKLTIKRFCLRINTFFNYVGMICASLSSTSIPYALAICPIITPKFPRSSPIDAAKIIYPKVPIPML